jgi:transposase
VQGRTPWFDNGDGQRRWRHVDVCFFTCELAAEAPQLPRARSDRRRGSPWACHASRFTLAFKDLVVFDAIVSSNLAAARHEE